MKSYLLVRCRVGSSETHGPALVADVLRSLPCRQLRKLWTACHHSAPSSLPCRQLRKQGLIYLWRELQFAAV